MHKLEVYVIDFENYGTDNYITELRSLDCGGSFLVKSSDTADIGEWHDDHECNKGSTPIEKFRSYFKKENTND